MGNTTRFAKLLGECRRQMNGAVASSMRYYGVDYGLNYGVSIATVRLIAREEGIDHSFAKYLYLQEVREIRLASLHIADAEQITVSELEFWSKGIINSEVAEEAAFALLSRVPYIKDWLECDNELLVYAAILAIAKGKSMGIDELEPYIYELSQSQSILHITSLITLLGRYFQEENNRIAITKILDNLPQSSNREEIILEMAWRCDIG